MLRLSSVSFWCVSLASRLRLPCVGVAPLLHLSCISLASLLHFYCTSRPAAFLERHDCIFCSFCSSCSCCSCCSSSHCCSCRRCCFRVLLLSVAVSTARCCWRWLLKVLAAAARLGSGMGSLCREVATTRASTLMTESQPLFILERVYLTLPAAKMVWPRGALRRRTYSSECLKKRRRARTACMRLPLGGKRLMELQVLQVPAARNF